MKKIVSQCIYVTYGQCTYTLTESGLVDLDGTDTSVLKVDDLVAERKRELHALDLAGDIGTGERPVEDGDGASQHTLHGLGGKALSVLGPLDGDGARAGDVGDDDGRADVAGTVGLDPAVLGEDEAMEALTEVLNHVVTLGLTVDEDVEANALLEADDALDLLLDELVVLLLGDLLLAELGTSSADLLGLGERADSGGGELGELKLLLLDLLADGEGAFAVQHVGSDSGDALADSVVGGVLELAALGDRSFVGFECSGDLGVLGAREDSSDGGNLFSFLESEGEPITGLSRQLLLAGECDWSVEERGGGRDDDTLSGEGINGLLTELDGSSDVVLPDVTTRDEAEGKDEVFNRLDDLEDLRELPGSTVEVNVETSDTELGNDVEVGVETTVVGREQDKGSDGDDLVVGGLESGRVVGSGVKNEDGLVNLDPLSASGLELAQELLVDREQLRKEGNGLEARLSLLSSLAEDKERDGSENDGAGSDARGLGLLELLNSLVEQELELGLLRELGDDKVVVGVEPSQIPPN